MHWNCTIYDKLHSAIADDKHRHWNTIPYDKHSCAMHVLTISKLE